MRHANKVLASLVALAFLLAAYCGLYLAAVEVDSTQTKGVIVQRGDWNYVEYVPMRVAKYRFGGQSASVLFQPAHELDRALRPGVWD